MRTEPRRDPLDLAIDRVVEAMVEGTGETERFRPVPFAPRAAAAPRWRRPMAVAASLAIVVAIVAWLWGGRPSTVGPAGAGALTSTSVAPAAIVAMPRIDPVRPVTMGAPAAGVLSRTRPDGGGAPAARLENVIDVNLVPANVGGPEALVVEGLTLAPLGMAALAIDALGVEEIVVVPLVIPAANEE